MKKQAIQVTLLISIPGQHLHGDFLTSDQLEQLLPQMKMKSFIMDVHTHANPIVEVGE